MPIEPYGHLALLDLYERLVEPTIDTAMDAWLAEDLGDVGDITTASLVAPDLEIRCEVRARQHGIVAGLPILDRMIVRRGGMLRAEPLAADGDRIEPGMRVLEVVGPLSALLPMERTALNLLGRLSGVATLTRQFVDLVAGTKAQIVDTRKTTPGLRYVEKYAVRCGGGHLHRIGLYDGVLVKDNHIAALEDHELGPAVEALAEAARGHAGAAFIEVEVDRLEQLDALLELPDGVLDIILLDNMGPRMIEDAVARRDARRASVLLEASGGVSLETVRAIAEAGVDRIAVGVITHSAPQIDFGLDSV
jgi:nicotinate-nucleotide pyrophosphorylase (carboxylating)